MILSLILAAMAGAGIAYNTTYDCGPSYATFSVRSCAAGVCDVTYKNPGGATKRVRLRETQLTNAIAGGCHPVKSASAYRNEAARYEAQANALLARSPGANAKPRGGSLVLGKYECYAYSGGELQSAMALNFTLYGGDRFADYTGHPGTYTYSGGVVTFRGTGLSGHRALYKPGVPHSNNPPHLTFLQANGDEGDSCDGQG